MISGEFLVSESAIEDFGRIFSDPPGNLKDYTKASIRAKLDTDDLMVTGGNGGGSTEANGDSTLGLELGQPQAVIP